jgi:hypothetical protein
MTRRGKRVWRAIAGLGRNRCSHGTPNIGSQPKSSAADQPYPSRIESSFGINFVDIKLDAAAHGAGFSRRTLYRARQALSDAVSDLGTGPRDSHKRWAIAEGAPAAGDTPTCE